MSRLDCFEVTGPTTTKAGWRSTPIRTRPSSTGCGTRLRSTPEVNILINVETDEQVACAFPKFFNLDENEDVQFEKLPWDQPYEVYEKLDGWLGVLYRRKGEFYVSSRGSFHSPGAEWASEFIKTKDLSALPDEVTLVFEIITPEQRIILDYEGDRNLHILAAFNRLTGDEYPRAKAEEWAAATGLPIVKKHDSLTIEDCQKIAEEVEGTEGFVIRFSDGRRVKVKTDWYCHLAKIMMNLSPISMWECMEKGRVPRSRLTEIPEELRALAESYKDQLEEQYKLAVSKVYDLTDPVLAKFTGDPKSHETRRALGLSLKDAAPLIKRTAFLRLDNNNEAICGVCMDLIYPKSNEFVDIDDSVRDASEHGVRKKEKVKKKYERRKK